MTRRNAKTFERGEVVEVQVERADPWKRMKYLNAYRAWHIVENRNGDRIPIPSRRIRKRVK